MSDLLDISSIRRFKNPRSGKWETCYIQKFVDNAQAQVLFKNNGRPRTVGIEELRNPTQEELNEALNNLLQNSTRGVSFL